MTVLKLAGTLPVLALVAGFGMSTDAQAASIDPTFQTFGDLDAATTTEVNFGGSGIPTGPAAISEFAAANGDTLLLGLLAHKRFSNPPLGNDGAGTYTAQAGANDGTPGNPGTRSTWNFAWFAEVTGANGSTLSDYNVTLLYDLDPSIGTDESTLGSWVLGTTLSSLGAPGDLFQTSQNPTFGFLATDDASFGITAPSFKGFDPFAGGEYSFALSSTLGAAAINVNVSPIPVPAALPLLLAGLGGLGLVARRKRKAA